MVEKRSILSLIVLLIGLLAMVDVFLVLQQSAAEEISLKASVASLQKSGGQVNMQIKVDNLKPQPANNVTVRLELPTGFTAVGTSTYQADFKASGSKQFSFSITATAQPGSYTLQVFVERGGFRDTLPITVSIERAA